MTLTPAWLDELRARTLLSSVIAPSVKLIRAGREWKACCPFHNEKTPSFTINDEKGFYHCFGCGAHGDAIRFLTDQRGLPFMDAVKELAGKAGMGGTLDGVGTAAMFFNPVGLAWDGARTLFVGDPTACNIRKIDLQTAQVTTLAGTPSEYRGFRNALSALKRAGYDPNA